MKYLGYASSYLLMKTEFRESAVYPRFDKTDRRSRSQPGQQSRQIERGRGVTTQAFGCDLE